MTELTRRRDKESAREKWNILYGDVCVDSIGLRAGVANHADQWEWKCGFILVATDRPAGRPLPLSRRARRSRPNDGCCCRV